MRNHNDQAMASYFSSMLSEKPSKQDTTEKLVDVADVQLQTLQEPLHSLPDTLVFSPEQESVDIVVKEDLSETIDISNIAVEEWQQLSIDNEFQVLFFELAGLTFAIPLTDLGGIHKLDRSLNSLLGKPDWFTGVMTHNDSLFNIVDTAKWVNPALSTENLNYSHYVLLGSTEWGLSCEKLLGTETLTKEQIKWRTSAGRRPWLAGMVKDKMCALLHAEELVKLLNSGMNIHSNK